MGHRHTTLSWINPHKGIPVNVSLFRLSLARSTTNNGHSFIVTRQQVIGTKLLGCIQDLLRTRIAVSGQQSGNAGIIPYTGCLGKEHCYFTLSTSLVMVF